MSLLDSAKVTVLLADYVAADSNGKLTAVGAAFTLTGLGPDGNTPPQHVAVLVDVPASHLGQDFALGLSLLEEGSDSPVQIPGPSGQMDALRVAQVVQAQAPSVPGMIVSPNLPSRVQLVLGFPAGLPLQTGKTYRWTVEIDGQTRDEWSAWFHVPTTAPGPVFGGPSGPSSIPRI